MDSRNLAPLHKPVVDVATLGGVGGREPDLSPEFGRRRFSASSSDPEVPQIIFANEQVRKESDIWWRGIQSYFRVIKLVML